MRCRLLAIAALLAVTTSADASDARRVETLAGMSPLPFTGCSLP